MTINIIFVDAMHMHPWINEKSSNKLCICLYSLHYTELQAEEYEEHEKYFLPLWKYR